MAISDREIPPLDRSDPDRQRGLVLAHQAGDVEAFPAIVRDSYPALASHAARRLGDPRAAEDAVQEALLRAYRALPTFNGDYHLRAWLHRILDNVCHDEGCRRKRESDANERWAAMPAESPMSAEELSDVSVARDQVARAIAQLPDSYREALVLRDIYELEYADVASRAGITEQNARARVHRARVALRRLVEGTGAFGAVARGFRRATQWVPRVAQHVSNSATAVSEAANLPARAGYAITVVATTSAAAAVVAGPLLGGSLAGTSSQRPPTIEVSAPASTPTSVGAVTVGSARWSGTAVTSAVPLTTTSVAPTTTAAPTTTSSAARVVVGPPAGASSNAPAPPVVLAEIQSSRVVVDAGGGATEEPADLTVGRAAPIAGSLTTTLVLPAAGGPACTGSLNGRFYWTASGSVGASRLTLTAILVSGSAQPGATVYAVRGTAVVSGDSAAFAGDTDVTGTITVPDDGSLGTTQLVFTHSSGGTPPAPCAATTPTSTSSPAGPSTTTMPPTSSTTVQAAEGRSLVQQS